MISGLTMQSRRDCRSNWILNNPILREGEMALEYPDKGIEQAKYNIKIGDGINEWVYLPYTVDNDNIFQKISRKLLIRKIMKMKSRSDNNEQE